MSRSRVSLLILVLAAVAANGGGVPDTRDPRPQLAVRVEIDTSYYRHYLRGGFDTLRSLVQDTIAVLLKRRFGFINWGPGSPAPAETVVVRWRRQSPKPMSPIQLEFALAGKSRDAAPVVSPFEEWAEINERMSRPGEQRPGAVRRAWLQELDTILEARGGEIVAQVVGRVPLNADVAVMQDYLQGVVQVRANEIEAAEEPAPEFRIRALIVDPGPVASLSTVGRGELFFTRCGSQVGTAYYVCHLERLRYRNQTLLIPQDTAAVALIRRARLDSTALYVWAYTSAWLKLAAGGAIYDPRP